MGVCGQITDDLEVCAVCIMRCSHENSMFHAAAGKGSAAPPKFRFNQKRLMRMSLHGDHTRTPENTCGKHPNTNYSKSPWRNFALPGDPKGSRCLRSSR